MRSTVTSPPTSIDARTLTGGTQLRSDVAIVGSGPAGFTIADRLRGSGLDVTLIEAGGTHPDKHAQDVFDGENVGHPYFPLNTCRFRVFGGGSNRWGGWCRPLEPDDFVTRSWIDGSGWPIGAADLEPFYADAAELLGLPAAAFDVDAWSDVLPAPLDLRGDEFTNALFLYSPQLNFAERYAPRLAQAANVTTLLHANVTELRLDPDGRRIEAVRIRATGGGEVIVRARAVVLAAGGIENARLLLASDDQRPAGLGNEHDLVGRYFMDHLHVPVGHLRLTTTDGAVPAFYRKATYPTGLKTRGVVTPTAQARERYGLLGASIAIEGASYAYGTPFLGWSPALTFGAVRAYRRLRSGRGERLAEWLRGTSEQIWNVSRRMETARAARDAQARAGADGGRPPHSLYFRTEQMPDRDSRVTLDPRNRDAYGMPRTRLEWRVADRDLDAIRRSLERFDAQMRADGLGTVIPPAEGWEAGIIGGPHHLGTTRMHADPRHGVVDADGRLHSVPNLYVAGSSTFTTGGFANPTFTIVALALRQAEHLRSTLT